MSEYVVELIEDGDLIGVEMEQYDVIAGGDAEKAIPCAAADWVLSDGYYIFTVPTSTHGRGFSARAVGAESNADAAHDATVSYRRLPNGTVLIVSNLPFEGRIFIK